MPTTNVRRALILATRGGSNVASYLSSAQGKAGLAPAPLRSGLRSETILDRARAILNGSGALAIPLSGGLFAQTPQPAPAGGKLSFEVASIKPNKTGPGMWSTSPGGRETIIGRPVRSLIAQAFGLLKTTNSSADLRGLNRICSTSSHKPTLLAKPDAIFR